MGRHTITYNFELNDAQEELIDNILKEVDCFNYLKADVLDFIIHSEFYYKLLDEIRTDYNDLFQPIVDAINGFETSLM